MTSGQGLLNKSIEAHGGLNRWKTIKDMVVRIRCKGHKNFSGLIIPTSRQVLPRKSDGSPQSFPTLVWIEVDQVVILER